MIAPLASIPTWQPTCIERVLSIADSSMRTVRVMTDAGEAYIKPLGGCDAGPHPLACEYIGSSLAKWLGLSIPEFAIMNLDDLDAEMIQDVEEGIAQPGHGFVSKLISNATPWDGTAKNLEGIYNIDDICGIVILDTWTLNWDRCHNGKMNLDNVLLANSESGKVIVWTIDQGECISVARELSPRKLATIDRIKDERVFGLFSGFKPHMRSEAIDFYLERLLLAAIWRLRKIATLTDSLCLNCLIIYTIYFQT